MIQHPFPQPPTFSKLHWYQCRSCQTLATTPVKVTYGRPLCCNLCHSYMAFKWSEPIQTQTQRDLAQRGVVWNPGSLADERADDKTLPSDGGGRR